MNSAQQAEIVNALRRVAESAQEPAKGRLANFRMHDEVSYSLPAEAVALHAEQVRALLTHKGFQAKFSGKHVAKRLNKLIAELLKDPTYDVDGGLANLVNECATFNDVVDVYLPLDGVHFRLSEPLQIGGVSLVNGDEVLLEEVRTKLTAVVAGSVGSGEQKQAAAKRVEETLKQELLGRCVVRYTVVAEPERATERAREEARFAIDLFRLTSKFFYPIAEDVRFGLRGERERIETYGFVVSDQVFHTASHRLGSLFPFELTQSFVSKLDELGLLSLAQRRHEGRGTPIDLRLARAIHWLSVGLVQDEAETALISMIVSLECLFTRDSGQSIASSVAESTAFLLGKPGDGRRRIAEHIQAFYRMRSKLAHGGTVVVSTSDRALLVHLVISTICSVLEKRPEVSDPKALFHWIDNLKYG